MWRPGLFRADSETIHAINTVDPAITIATLPDLTRVTEGTLVATVKIIPYSVAGTSLDAALAVAEKGSLEILAPILDTADLVLTKTEALSDKAMAKGRRVIEARLDALDVKVASVQIVAHSETAVATALSKTTAPLVLILGASATSDAADVCPAGLVESGGKLERFGMPVDPGNLLFMGSRRSQHVMGLPGCARSPALNGADWVLERLVCGVPVDSQAIARMGVGGLLKEIPTRPQPRLKRSAQDRNQTFEVVLLAAGRSSRMKGRDKLLEEIDGVPLLRRATMEAVASRADRVHVVIPPDREEREAVIADLDVGIVIAENAAEGMAASLVAGLRGISREAAGVIVMLGDMPDIGSGELNRLMARFDPDKGHEICRAVSDDGTAGHPVLFGQRFLEELMTLEGDIGARAVVAGNLDYVVDVPLEGAAAQTDLDTPEAWAAWRANRVASGE